VRDPDTAVYKSEYSAAARAPYQTSRSPGSAPDDTPEYISGEQTEFTPIAPRYRVIGETMNRYIAAEFEDKLVLIDKHAAHERIHFDRLKAEDYAPSPQTLLAPVILRPADDGAELLLENAELLSRLGFEIEPFGKDALAVRQIPSEIDIADAQSALLDIEQELRNGSRDLSARRDEILASVACKAAIKSGKSGEREEMDALCDAVFSGKISFCPHGRPVSVEFTKNMLDKMFKRG